MLILFFAGNFNDSWAQDESQMARAALAATVRPQQKERPEEDLNQTASPRTQHSFASA